MRTLRTRKPSNFKDQVMDNLIRTYERTSYWVDAGDRRICLRFGESNSDLDETLARFGVTDWAYITAYNPGSNPLSREENEERQIRLIRDVRAKGYGILSGEGRGAASDWPPESSVLILGVPVEEARRLGIVYGQTAMVFGRRNEPPRLVPCAYPTV